MRIEIRSTGRVILWLVLPALWASACAANKVAPPPSEGSLQQRAGSMSKADPTSGSATRLFVRTASIEVVVASVPQAAEEAVRLTEQAGGYIHDSSMTKDGRGTFDLRVPAAQLDAVLDQLAKLGEEKSRRVSTEDVTDRVTDLDAELANKRALRDRLRDLLARAKDVKDVLAVENELTRVQTDIDSLEARLKKMRDDVAFSSVSLTLFPQAEKQSRILGPLGYLYVGTKWFVTKLFVIRSGSDD